jgi:NADH-quinone oxidoreductase subunit E
MERLMGDQTQGCRGKAGIWAGITGLVVAVFLMVVAHEPFYVAVFLGLLTVLLFGAFLIWAFCSGTGAPGSADGTGAERNIARKPDPMPSPSDLEAPVSAFNPQSPEGEAAHKQAEVAAPDASVPAETQPAPAQDEAPSKPAPAKAESASTPAATAKPKAAAKPAAEKKAAAKKTAAEKPAAEKKTAAKKPAAAKAAKPKASATAPAQAADGAAQKPKGLEAPRAAGADDLTKIEGIGPKLAETLNGWGVYHFDQIAKWGANEIAYADTNVPRFKGRCTRDKWVAQAKIIVEEGMDAFLERAKTNDY